MSRRARLKCCATIAAALAAFAPASVHAKSPAPTREQTLFQQGYEFGLPIIMSYKTMYFYAVDDSSLEYKAPFNQLKSIARVYGPQDRAVVSANSDTPYSLAWLDLRAEPVVICVPEIEQERYFSLMLQDLSTNLLPYIGSRTTGNGGGCHMVVESGWQGDTPEGVDTMITSQTAFVFAVIRTQLFNADDLENVKQVQAGYSVEPLSSFLEVEAPTPAPVINWLEWNETAATGEEFVDYLNLNLQFLTPSPAEQKVLADLAQVGIGAGLPFEAETLSTEMQSALSAGVQAAVDNINAKIADIPVLAGDTAEGYGEDWLRRAAITQMGWGANAGVEASYPNYATDADGDALDGSTASYTLTFAKGQQPPVNAFWSITMYDANTQLMIANPIDRYLLNSPMVGDMTVGEDGALTLYIQKDSPGEALEANWLPAPDGPFYMLMRLYWPQDAFLNGDWTPPAVVKSN